MATCGAELMYLLQPWTLFILTVLYVVLAASRPAVGFDMNVSPCKEWRDKILKQPGK